MVDVSPGARCKAFKQRYFRAELRVQGSPSRLRMTRSFFPRDEDEDEDEWSRAKNSNWNHVPSVEPYLVTIRQPPRSHFCFSFSLFRASYLSLSLSLPLSFGSSLTPRSFSAFYERDPRASPRVLSNTRTEFWGHTEIEYPGDSNGLEHTDKEETQNIYNVTWIDFVTWQALFTGYLLVTPLSMVTCLSIPIDNDDRQPCSSLYIPRNDLSNPTRKSIVTFSTFLDHLSNFQISDTLSAE